jgi:glycosyltransferase involved in cell wall biosynthesis
MLLDIIIIGKNEEKTLPRVFESVLKASDRFFNHFKEYPQIIYIDSNSNDKSVNIAQDYKINFKVIKGKSNAARGRIEGADITSSEFIFFLDGDTEVAESWLVKSVETLINDQSLAGVGGILDFNIYKNDKLVNIIQNYRGIRKDYEEIFDGVGGTFTFRRSVYKKAGGFDSQFRVAEEFDLFLRVVSETYKMVRLKVKMAIHHDYKTSDESFVKRYLLSKNIFIPGQIVRKNINSRTALSIYRKHWLHIINPILVIGMIISLINFKAISFFIFISLMVILHLIYKRGNLKRGLLSIFTMNFYSFGFYIGFITRKKMD